MEFVGVFHPAVADVGAVVHVGDEDVADAGIHLGLRLLHGAAGADDDEHDAGSPRDEPLAVVLFYVFDVDAVLRGLFEDDGGVSGKRFKRGVVVERKRRDDNAHADLKSGARAPLGLEAVGKLPKEFADRSQQAFLLDADGGISEARCEFERIDAVVVDDAIQVDIADVAFLRELRLHF